MTNLLGQTHSAAVMRMEHAQITDLLRRVESASNAEEGLAIPDFKVDSV